MRECRRNVANSDHDLGSLTRGSGEPGEKRYGGKGKKKLSSWKKRERWD